MDTPLDCIKRMTELAKAGEIISVEFWLHESHLQVWALETLQAMKNGEDDDDVGPLFGDAGDVAVVAALKELCEACGCPCDDVITAAAPSIASRLLLDILIKWLADMADSGELTRIILALLDKLAS